MFHKLKGGNMDSIRESDQFSTMIKEGAIVSKEFVYWRTLETRDPQGRPCSSIDGVLKTWFWLCNDDEWDWIIDDAKQKYVKLLAEGLKDVDEE